MNRAALLAGAVILAAGVAAVSIAPKSLPVPSRLYSAAGESGSRSNPRVIHASMSPVEHGSPAIGPGGKLAESVGIQINADGFRPILLRDAPLPAAGQMGLKTSEPGQAEMKIHLLRGLSERASENHSIGWFRIGGLAAGREAGARVMLYLSATDGALLAAAVDGTSSLPLTLEPAVPPLPSAGAGGPQGGE